MAAVTDPTRAARLDALIEAEQMIRDHAAAYRQSDEFARSERTNAGASQLAKAVDPEALATRHSVHEFHVRGMETAANMIAQMRSQEAAQP